MADKSFGVKELNLLGSSGTPSIESPNDLNLNANTVAISTNLTVGSKLSVTSAGIVTAVSGVVTYYGDGSFLDGIEAGVGANGSVNTTGIITASEISSDKFSGIWSGSAIKEEFGGTNQSTYTKGDILYASNPNTLSKLAVGSDTDVLTLTSGVPAWEPASTSGVPGVNTEGTSTFEIVVINGNAGIGSLNVSGVATFHDDVSIGGTLTYEDVTNVDSVGLITARSGIEVSAGSRVLIGHDATVDTSTYNSNLQIMGTNADGSSITVGRFSDDGSSSSLNLSKSRSQSVGIGSSVKNNDVIGNIFWWGDDGADYEEVAHIGVQAGAAFTSGSTPGYLTFWTTPVDATIAIERLRIDSSGHITQKFTTNNSTTAEGLFINNKNNGTGNNASLIFSNDSGERKKAALAYIDTGDYGAGDLVFALDGADSGNLHLTDDEKVRITLDGDVGIGTTNPTATNITDALQSNTSVLAVGVVTAKTFYGDGTFLTGTGGGSLIEGISVQDEGSSVGTSGSITTLNFCGSAINATISGDDTAIVTVTGGALALDPQYNLYGGQGAGASSDTDTCYNIGIGYSAAHNLNSGDNNLMLGKDAGYCLTSGQYNVFLGCHTGYNNNGSCNFFAVNGAGCHNDTGINNIFIGSGAGAGTNATTKSASENIALGRSAGACLDTGDHNVFLGQQAALCTTSGGCNIYLGWCVARGNKGGSRNIVMGCKAASGSWNIVTDGSDNVILGSRAGCMLSIGDHNVFLGTCAGIAITTGNQNIGLGYSAGADLWGGSRNVFLGVLAGKNITTGDDNIAIGYGVSFPSPTGSCQLIIGQCLGNWITGDSSWNIKLSNNCFAITGHAGAGATIGPADAGVTTYYGDGQYLDNIVKTGSGGQGGASIDSGIIVGTGLSISGISTVGFVTTGDIWVGGASTFIGKIGVTTNIEPLSDNDVNLGASNKRWRMLKTGDITIFNRRIYANNLVTDPFQIDAAGVGVTIADNFYVSGISTFGGNINANGNIEGDSSTNISGIASVTAATFYGDGSHLLGLGGETLISGITVQEEGTNVGTGGSITTINFLGDAITATAGAGSSDVNVTVTGGSLWISNDTGINTTSKVGIGTTTNLNALLTLQATSGSSNDLIAMSAVGAASTERIILTSSTLDNGTVSFEGSEGSLFSVTNNLSSGSIFSVNDISGVPSIDVDADGTIQLAPLASGNTGKVGIGTTNPSTRLHVEGNVKVTGVVTATDFDSTSDIRLKTNIKPIDDPLAKVVQIEGVSFNWKKDNRPALGVIADQIEKVIPELVHGDDPKTVNYNGLVGLLIEVVKDQQTQIDDLNKRLSKLE